MMQRFLYPDAKNPLLEEKSLIMKRKKTEPVKVPSLFDIAIR